MPHRNDDRSDRISLMLAAIADVAPHGHPRQTTMDRASDQHKRLFAEYLTALRGATQKADARWNGLVENLMARSGRSRDRAVRELLASKRANGASHVEFVGTVRRYWLRCASTNETVPDDQRVPPEEFVLRWPADAHEDACVEMLTHLTYFPVGLDRDGRWM